MKEVANKSSPDSSWHRAHSCVCVNSFTYERVTSTLPAYLSFEGLSTWSAVFCRTLTPRAACVAAYYQFCPDGFPSAGEEPRIEPKDAADIDSRHVEGGGKETLMHEPANENLLWSITNRSHLCPFLLLAFEDSNEVRFLRLPRTAFLPLLRMRPTNYRKSHLSPGYFFSSGTAYSVAQMSNFIPSLRSWAMDDSMAQAFAKAAGALAQLPQCAVRASSYQSWSQAEDSNHSFSNLPLSMSSPTLPAA
jgi:hypothetical protein